MAGYDDEEIDDQDDVPTTGGRAARAIGWLLVLGLAGGAVIQAQALRDVAYGTIPGEFLGDGENQLKLEEAIVNEPSTAVYSRADAASEVLFTARAGTRFQLLGREGEFFKLPLPQGQVGYMSMRDATPGFLFLKDEAERVAYERKYFPGRFVHVSNSLWEDMGNGRSQLAVEVDNRSAVALDKAGIRILFQNQQGETQESLDMMLEGRIEPGTMRTFEELRIDLAGRFYPRSSIEITSVSVAPDLQAQ